MSDKSDNPFEALLRQAQEMGMEWSRSLAPDAGALASGNLDQIWPQMPPEMMEAWFGKTFNPEGLDAKTKLLLTLQGLTMQGAHAETQFRLTVNNAVASGATSQEIAEAIGMAGLFGGAASVPRALQLALEVAKNGEG